MNKIVLRFWVSNTKPCTPSFHPTFAVKHYTYYMPISIFYDSASENIFDFFIGDFNAQSVAAIYHTIQYACTLFAGSRKKE